MTHAVYGICGLWRQKQSPAFRTSTDCPHRIQVAAVAVSHSQLACTVCDDNLAIDCLHLRAPSAVNAVILDQVRHRLHGGDVIEVN